MSDPSMERPNLLDSLKALALEEKWDDADVLISQACEDTAVMEWAVQEGVYAPEYQLRDLAVSLFERSSAPLPLGIEGRLETLMHTDENAYVQFRSAFALFAHGVRTEDVIGVIREALNDPDVAAIASEYLTELD